MIFFTILGIVLATKGVIIGVLVFSYLLSILKNIIWSKEGELSHVKLHIKTQLKLYYKNNKFFLRTDSLKKQLSFKNWLPKKKREEILGDLNEIKMYMIEDGESPLVIWLSLSWHKIVILFNLKKAQFAIWLATK